MTLVVLAALVLPAGGCRPGPGPVADDEHEHPGGDILPVEVQREVSGKGQVERHELPSEAAHPFSLVDQAGQRVSLASLRGKVVLLGFFYSNCPDACGVLAGQFSLVQRALAGPVQAGSVELLLVTTDPERDTPQRLNQYARALGGRLRLLTGTEEELEDVWKGYGIFRMVKRDGVIYHSYKTFLLDREGRLRYSYSGIWPPGMVIPDLERLLAEP